MSIGRNVAHSAAWRSPRKSGTSPAPSPAPAPAPTPSPPPPPPPPPAPSPSPAPAPAPASTQPQQCALIHYYSYNSPSDMAVQAFGSGSGVDQGIGGFDHAVLGVWENSGATGSGYSTMGACLQAINAKQRLRNPDATTQIYTIYREQAYINSAPANGGAPSGFPAVAAGSHARATKIRKLNNFKVPASQPDASRFNRWWLGLANNNFPGPSFSNFVYPVNTTCIVTPDNAGLKYPQWRAQSDGAEMWNHTVSDGKGCGDWTVCDVFVDVVEPVYASSADWRLDGVNRAGSDGTVFSWPDGVSGTIQQAQRRGYRDFITTIRAQRDFNEINGNVDVNHTVCDQNSRSDLGGSTIPAHPEFYKLLDASWSENTFGNAVASWSLECFLGGGSGSANYNNGTGFQLAVKRLNALKANTILGRLRCQTFSPTAGYGNGAGANWYDSPAAYQMMRYGTVGAWICGAAAAFAPGASTDASGYGRIARYDEWDAPLGNVVGSLPTSANYGGVWMVKFDNGICFLNATNADITIDTTSASLGAVYKALSGSQVPSVNNGATLGATTVIKAKDAKVCTK